MTTNKHTPTPWNIESEKSTPYGEIWIEHDEGCICRIDSPLLPSDYANAALIVRAVNNHEALLKALEAILTERERLDEHDRVLFLDDAIGKGREAIRKARGEA